VYFVWGQHHLRGACITCRFFPLPIPLGSSSEGSDGPADLTTATTAESDSAEVEDGLEVTAVSDRNELGVVLKATT